MRMVRCVCTNNRVKTWFFVGAILKKCVWVRPKLVAVVEFLEWTEGDRLRHSKFVGLRDDKNPRDVVKES
jgi:ATP-dependent DNA ligase